jgi:ABC-type transport system involved in cytochrome c biogenesis permease subunit
MRILLTLILCLISCSVHAQSLDMSVFRTIPVLEGGRIKPLDTFARSMLKTFSGDETPKGMDPDVWLAESLFDPGRAVERPVFYIASANIRHRLSVTERRIPLYSYMELTVGLGKTFKDIEKLAEKDKNDLSSDDRELLRTHENALLYSQILRTFSLILPLDISLPDFIRAKNNTPITWLDLKKSEQEIEAAARAIVKHKGEDLQSYTDDEKKTALLAYQMKVMGDAASRNQLMRLIPVSWDAGQQNWMSPWAVLNDGQGSPETARILEIWKRLAEGWQTGDSNTWNKASADAAITPLAVSGMDARKMRLDLEVAYNRIAPFEISIALYALSFLMVLSFFIGGKTFFARAARFTLCSGAFLHAGGIAARMILLERPPVSTLYESLVFVSLACVAIGLLIEWRLKNGAGLMIASVTGIGTLLMASSFGADGDTLLMLPAVLNTRFWLATHVLCITFGYGWCLAASVMGHLLLGAKAFRLMPGERIAAQTTMLFHLSLVALLFTSVGTILGGIWADQSWGRFWGWDPKENGALLIVLWLVWIVHGKLSGHLSPSAMLAGLSFLSVIVGAAWIGVNLLGVGLHSYGFADGVFTGLGLFTAAEIALIGTLWYLSERKPRPSLSSHAP